MTASRSVDICRPSLERCDRKFEGVKCTLCVHDFLPQSCKQVELAYFRRGLSTFSRTDPTGKRVDMMQSTQGGRVTEAKRKQKKNKAAYGNRTCARSKS